MGMADFHIALLDFKSAAHSLAASEFILNEKLKQAAELKASENEKISEMEVTL